MHLAGAVTLKGTPDHQGGLVLGALGRDADVAQEVSSVGGGPAMLAAMRCFDADDEVSAEGRKALRFWGGAAAAPARSGTGVASTVVSSDDGDDSRAESPPPLPQRVAKGGRQTAESGVGDDKADEKAPMCGCFARRKR